MCVLGLYEAVPTQLEKGGGVGYRTRPQPARNIHIAKCMHMLSFSPSFYLSHAFSLSLSLSLSLSVSASLLISVCMHSSVRYAAALHSVSGDQEPA